jgi:hypothetical protein
MKTKLHHPVTHFLLILGLGFYAASAQAQEQKDPYKKTAAIPAATPAPEAAPAPEARSVEMEHCVTATVEWIDLSTADAMSLMRGSLAPNSPELIQMIRDFEAQGKATLLDAQSVTTRAGQRAISEGIKEVMYPTEFQALDTKGLTQANVNLSSTQVKDGKITLQQEASSSASPISFQMRATGGRFELEAVVGADGKTLELSMAPEYIIFTGWQQFGSVRIGGETRPIVEQPHFASSKISTSMMIESGQTIVAGMTNVQKEDGTIDSTKKRLLLVHGLVFPVRPH